MFTGIVEETGAVLDVDETSDGLRIEFATSFDDLERGQSVCVSGACLTVEEFGRREAGSAGEAPGNVGEAPDTADGRDRWFSVFLADETRRRTYLGDLAPGDQVNLERAMPADGRFDGHVVQGHVDGTSEVLAVEEVGEDWLFTFVLPDDLARYLVEKGSITVDGISLTVADRRENRFSVAIIPETYRQTTLSETTAGDPVHLEVDVIAKYVERMMGDED
jgi:riboflavin synthase